MDYGLLVLGEVGIGLLIGFLLNLIFVAFQLAGEFFSLQMGFSASMVFDPQSQVEIPLMGEFLNLIAMLVFITTAGMSKFLLVGVQRSFQYLRGDGPRDPPGGDHHACSSTACRGSSRARSRSPSPSSARCSSCPWPWGSSRARLRRWTSSRWDSRSPSASSFILLFATMPFLMTAMERIIDGSFQSLSGFITTAGALRR